jgi:hypothetical protein
MQTDLATLDEDVTRVLTSGVLTKQEMAEVIRTSAGRVGRRVLGMHADDYGEVMPRVLVWLGVAVASMTAAQVQIISGPCMAATASALARIFGAATATNSGYRLERARQWKAIQALLEEDAS